MNVKISVIIPCYNVEKYIETCLESVLSQTYLNWEAVIVDDGSTDRTGVIADNYSSSDDRFRVFHKSNGGLADARNFGLSRATGEYLLFLDSDDFLMPGAMRALAECAAHGNSDIVVGDFVHVDEKGIVPDAIIVQEDLSNHAISQTGKKTLQDIYASKYHGLNLAAWGKLFRCCLFSEHNIAFPKGKVHEDIATTFKLFYFAEKVTIVSDMAYAYRIRSGSIMHSTFDTRFQDALSATREQICFFRDHQEKELYQMAVNNHIRHLIGVKYRLFRAKDMTEQEKKDIVKALSKEAIELLSTTDLPFIKKSVYMAAAILPAGNWMRRISA